MIYHLTKIIFFVMFLISPFFAHYLHVWPAESRSLLSEVNSTK